MLEAYAHRVIDRRGDSELAAAQLESLQQITAAFATALTAEQITDELVRHATDSMDAQVWMVLIDESGEGLDTVAAVGYDPDVVARHQWLRVDAPLPLAVVARTGQPLWFPDAREAFARWPRLGEVTPGLASLAVLPLEAEGRCLGGIALWFRQPHALSASDCDYLLTLSRIGGQAVRRARQYDHEHTIATTLQRGLLPELPDLATADACARYHPAAAGTQVGGDWYDVIALPEGRVGVVVGDVAGHSIEAAAVMGQMRSALRALARREEDPGEVITGLNAMAHDFTGMATTTLFYGVWDPARAAVDYVSAGHLPPLISSPDGCVRALHATPQVPIDVCPDTTYTTSRAQLEPGETLFAYTDGLVERRAESLDAGIARLTRVLESTPDGHLGDICDDILTRLRVPEQQDDTVLVALRLLGAGRAVRPLRSRGRQSVE